MSAAVSPYTLRPFDEANVARVVSGRGAHLSPADRTEAVRRLTLRGLGSAVIAAQLGISRRTVDRAKRRMA